PAPHFGQSGSVQGARRGSGRAGRGDSRRRRPFFQIAWIGAGSVPRLRRERDFVATRREKVTGDFLENADGSKPFWDSLAGLRFAWRLDQRLHGFARWVLAARRRRIFDHVRAGDDFRARCLARAKTHPESQPARNSTRRNVLSLWRK